MTAHTVSQHLERAQSDRPRIEGAPCRKPQLYCVKNERMDNQSGDEFIFGD